MKYRLCALLFTLVGLTGCASIDPVGALNSATTSAGEAAGKVVGEAIGQAIVRRYSPQFTQWYAGYLTRMAFNAQGYSVETAGRDYQPGEYTEWAVVSEDENVPTNRMKRALLHRKANGEEWWQVVYHDNASDDVIVMEALFTENRQKMLRMRAQFPDDEEPQELPVAEQNYQAPVVLSEESIAGATEGRETIRVPAGTFEATRVRFGGGTTAGQLWWLSDRVPGGVVKHQVSVSNGEDTGEDVEKLPTENYTIELQDYGSGARSQLGIDV
ncbi:hypothetical protein [Saccharospirillum salsuginis]|uniref:Lipoprotein n=1 Tax=Saccharospirillum salsuginis TaxID=418750 RepID=A0A918JZZ6_9GAMM|nr:hypothetical protein [Saccharospirillum salsuginis]GGX38897.1 hypothetical protein GCM10007392_01440 [Saccharospirillum salsuginis]